MKLKEQLIKCIVQDAPKNIALAEVLDSHIARILVSLNCSIVNSDPLHIYALIYSPGKVVMMECATVV